VTIRIGTATLDDIPDILASADALVATDAGVHDAAATNLGWASETGTAYCMSLLASGDNLVLLARDGDEVVGHLVGRLSGRHGFAVRSVTLDLDDLPPVAASPGPGRAGPSE